MRTLINRNQETTSFSGEFYNIAKDYMSKLTFTTREEYLDWVSEWKADYKLINTWHKKTKWSGRRDYSKTAIKKAHYQKRLGGIVDLTVAQKLRIKEIEAKYLIGFDLKPWYITSQILVWYMLIIRKAGKMRSAEEYIKKKQLVPTT